jgi:hypothetical protein
VDVGFSKSKGGEMQVNIAGVIITYLSLLKEGEWAVKLSMPKHYTLKVSSRYGVYTNHLQMEIIGSIYWVIL